MGMTTIHIKIDTRLKKAFDDKASKLGKSTDMIRTLMTAFVEGRVKITHNGAGSTVPLHQRRVK